MSTVRERVADIFELKIGLDKTKLSGHTFQELGMSELDMMMLAVCLEDEFKTIFDDEKLSELKGFDSLVSFVCSQVADDTKSASACSSS